MSNKCDGCPSKNKCGGEKECSRLTPKYGNIKNIIGVISGKGGVGKSTATGLMAVELRKAGYKVGVLDADITGPSMPRFFGANKKRAVIQQGAAQEEVKFEPVETTLGIKVMSLNLLTEVEDQPVIWRGPVINGVLNQMFGDTVWGELDYLLIDMPPGTGDIALTVMQSFPVDSMVIVSTPQNMVSMIVNKVIVMANKLNIPLLGVIENMSYVTCSCGEKIRIFSKTSAEEHAKYFNLDLIMELPVDLELTENMENGRVESYLVNTQKYEPIIKAIVK